MRDMYAINCMFYDGNSKRLFYDKHVLVWGSNSDKDVLFFGISYIEK